MAAGPVVKTTWLAAIAAVSLEAPCSSLHCWQHCSELLTKFCHLLLHADCSPRGLYATPYSSTVATEAGIPAAADAAGTSNISSISRAASAHGQLRQRTSGIGAVSVSDSVVRRSRSPSPYQDDEQADLINEDEVANLPPEVAALLKRKGLEERLSSKQKKWHDMKVRR
jgi:hypothetical protein